MKKLLLLLTLLGTTVGLLSAENKADFNTMNGGKSATGYSTYTSDAGWNATNCALLSPSAAADGELAPTLNGKTSAVGTVTSPTLSGGVGMISFDYTNTYSETKGVQLSISILQNGEVVKSETLTNTSVTQNEKYTFTTPEFNVEGDFQIEVKNLSPSKSSKNKDRVSIWNLTWTNYVGTPVKTLGDIAATYGEESTPIAGGDVLEGIKVGTIFSFSAENAESLVVTDSNNATIASGTDSATWTATETTGEELTVTAKLGEETKTMTFMVEVVPDVPVKTLGDIEVVYNETSIEIDSTVDFPIDAVVNVSSAEAQRIIYDLYDEENNMVCHNDITETGKITFDKAGTFTVMIFSYLDANQTEGFDETNSKSFWFTANVLRPALGEIVVTYGADNIPVTNGDENLSVEVGTTFTFSAANATNISVVTWMEEKTVVNENNDMATWTVNEPFEQDGVTVTATNGVDEVTFEFLLTVTPIELDEPSFDLMEGDATKVAVLSTKGDLHVWTLEYDKNGTLLKDNGEDVPASVVAKAPAADDNTWMNKVADEGVPYEILVPTTEGNYLKIRAKSVFNGVHSAELVKMVDSNGGLKTGVETVVVDDENATVEYFNVQGVRVNADQPGLYIRRQGSKVEKVTIR